jgi:PAS domain S-box-containing protein
MSDEGGLVEALRASLDSPTTEPDPRAAALRKMVAKLVFETTAEAIWLIDAQARTTFVNRHTAELLGYTEDEMLGMHVFELMDEERKSIAQQNLMRRQRGIEERHEVKLRRKDGSSVWVIGSANPVYDRQGRYAGSLGVFGDLTAQKETELRLRAEVEELKRRLAARPNEAAAPRASGGSDAGTSGYREPFRSAIVVAVYGTLVASIALLTAGGVVSALLERGTPSPDQSAV